MDLSILVRLVPALGAAIAVAMVIDPDRAVGRREATDEVLRAVLVGVLTARLAWLLLGGASSLGAALSTSFLVRSGVETGIGVLASAIWIGRRDDGDRAWRTVAAVPAWLASMVVWHGLCQVEGVCGGVPTSTFGVLLPGRAGPSFPASYVEAALAAVLLAWAWTARRSPQRLWLIGAVHALSRVALGFARPALVRHPTTDQITFAMIAIGCLWIAWWHRGRQRPDLDLPQAPIVTLG